MTDIAIQEQITAIKKATAKALKSKASARKFLTDAGIIKQANSLRSSAKKKK